MNIISCIAVAINVTYLILPISAQADPPTMPVMKYTNDMGKFQEECPPNAPIKATLGGAYHVPGGNFYNKVSPRHCFANTKDAEFAGYKASTR